MGKSPRFTPSIPSACTVQPKDDLPYAGANNVLKIAHLPSKVCFLAHSSARGGGKIPVCGM